MDKELIYKNLKNLRKKNLMTQQDVANILGVTKQAYSNYESGKRSITLKFLLQISDYYQITIDQLVKTPIESYSKIGKVNS